MADGDSQLFNVKKAAEFLGVDPSTIRKWAQEQKLSGKKLGTRGDWRFLPQELNKMFHNNANGPNSKIKKQLYKIFMEAPVPIAILKGPKHIYELSNPQNNLAIGVDNPVGISVKELMPDNSAIVKILDDVYRTGVPFYTTEYPLTINSPTKGLQTMYVNATYQPLRDDNDKIIGIMVTGIDVTNSVIARTEREEYEHKLTSMFESVTDGFVLYDKDWRFMYINQKAIR
jgi:hypothetical protein